MKDSLFEMLLNLFEKTLSKLKESQTNHNELEEDLNQADIFSELEPAATATLMPEFVKSAQPDSMRIFTYIEQMKLTKASYQFLMRLLAWDIIHRDTLELIINQLLFSDSRMITLEEAKWTVRDILSDSLDAKQLAFLDLVLYQKEEAYSKH